MKHVALMNHKDNWIPDWHCVLRIEEQEYAITANIYLTAQDSYDPFNRLKTDTEVEATLDGWSSLPEIPEDHPHYAALEQELLAVIKDREWWI